MQPWQGPERVSVRGLALQAVAFFGSHWEKFAVLATVVFVGIAITLKVCPYSDLCSACVTTRTAPRRVCSTCKTCWLGFRASTTRRVCYATLLCTALTCLCSSRAWCLCSVPALFSSTYRELATLGLSLATITHRFWRGMLAIWLGGSLGQAFAFLLGRYMLRDCIVTLARGKSKRWEVFDKAIELDGWKLVLLLRLSPLVPYNLLNISMAMTRINFWQFSLVSAVGALLRVCRTFSLSQPASHSHRARVCATGVLRHIGQKRARRGEWHCGLGKLDGVGAGGIECGDMCGSGNVGNGGGAVRLLCLS